MQTLAPWDDLYPFIDILYIYTHLFFIFFTPIYMYLYNFVVSDKIVVTLIISLAL